ncbi:NAD(P)/FAD-dependent oxidoreductase [Botrimarina sp.]|uniref:NAD(P)/FAD-dependent oxidoreductase n=1 Tax=Botrimarina sp. TaxID=2795802 RepID=UPI0032EC9181
MTDSSPLYDALVLGAGAAGLLCAARAAERGKRVLVLEKNNKAAVKVLMSGGTRCNLTHDASPGDIADAYARLAGGAEGKAKARWLRPALARLTPDALIALFAAEGLATKIESTGKVFPESDRALDVQRALLRMVASSGAEVALGEAALSVERSAGGFVVATSRRTLRARNVVVAVGGRSWPGCGTTGDGYAWAKALGHRVVPPRPALVPLTSTERWALDLQGVTLSDVRLRLIEGERGDVRIDRRGSLLFTHFGLSGPVAMDCSRFVTQRPDAIQWRAVLDLAPSVGEEQLQERLAERGGQTVLSLLGEVVPRRVAEATLGQAGVPLERRLAELSRAQRRATVDAVKRPTLRLAGSLGFKKAEVTAGGVDLDEVDPRTCQSRLVPGLYFIGEVLDLDGPIGGYNFQAAFSTAALAGDSVA